MDLISGACVKAQDIRAGLGKDPGKTMAIAKRLNYATQAASAATQNALSYPYMRDAIEIIRVLTWIQEMFRDAPFDAEVKVSSMGKHNET